MTYAPLKRSYGLPRTNSRCYVLLLRQTTLSVNHQILSLVLCANVNSNNLIIHLFKELGIDYLGGPVLHLYMAYALALSLCIGAHLRGLLIFHTSYLSFFLHGQNFWKIKFTLKFTQ